VRLLGHSMKSSATWIGAQSCAKTAEALDAACNVPLVAPAGESHHPHFRWLLARLETEVATLCAYFNKLEAAGWPETPAQ
jgi:HPt (histidine-containing phosphotransfer) domain-containing protein